MAGYTAFVDESGCDGFDFDNGSSDFLVLGAIVSRTSNLSQFDDAANRIRAELKKPSDWNFKSFKKLANTSAQRWCIAKNLAMIRCAVAAVAIFKRGLEKEEWQKNKDDLYFQASKFLLERISWACRDTHKKAMEFDPRCEIIFSKKGNLRYDRLADYMRRLQSDPAKYDTKADWHHLDPDLVRDEPHDHCNPCHQASDHFASAIGSALEFKEHGTFDDRYARLWAERFYKPAVWGNVVANGFKVWPGDGYKVLRADPRGQWLKMSFGW